MPLLDLIYHPWSSFWKKSAWWQQQTLMKDQALDIQAQTRLSKLETDRARAWALPWIPGMGLRRVFKCTKQNTYSDFQALSQNLGSGQPRAWALLQKSGSRPSKRHVPLTDTNCQHTTCWKGSSVEKKFNQFYCLIMILGYKRNSKLLYMKKNLKPSWR